MRLKSSTTKSIIAAAISIGFTVITINIMIIHEIAIGASKNNAPTSDRKDSGNLQGASHVRWEKNPLPYAQSQTTAPTYSVEPSAPFAPDN